MHSGVFVARQVKDAVYQEQIQLLIQMRTRMGCLPCRGFHTDYNISQAGRIRPFPSSFPLWESQNIGRAIAPQVLSVQLLHPSIAHQQNR